MDAIDTIRGSNHLNRKAMTKKNILTIAVSVYMVIRFCVLAAFSKRDSIQEAAYVILSAIFLAAGLIIFGLSKEKQP